MRIRMWTLTREFRCGTLFANSDANSAGSNAAASSSLMKRTLECLYRRPFGRCRSTSAEDSRQKVCGRRFEAEGSRLEFIYRADSDDHRDSIKLRIGIHGSRRELLKGEGSRECSRECLIECSREHSTEYSSRVNLDRDSECSTATKRIGRKIRRPISSQIDKQW